MTRTWAATDAVEPIADTDAEQHANQHLYGVLSGCEVTYDAADLTYDVAAGVILHNGGQVTVAAQTNAGTLVPDITNPRWATIYLDSSGVEGVVHGTAAVDPSKPETGDNVEIGMVLVPAGQTIASTITNKLDKRIMTHSAGAIRKWTTATQTINASTAFVDAISTGFPATMSFAIGANETWMVRAYLRIIYTGTGGVQFQFTGPAAPTSVRVTGTHVISYPTGSVDTQRDLTLAAPEVTALSTAFAQAGAAAAGTGQHNTADSGQVSYVNLFIINGANAGTVALQFAQSAANGTTVMQIGSLMEAVRLA